MGDGGGGHWLVRMEWRPAGWSVCLPLLILPCTIKSRSSLLAPAHPGGPGKRAVKQLCVVPVNSDCSWSVVNRSFPDNQSVMSALRIVHIHIFAWRRNSCTNRLRKTLLSRWVMLSYDITLQLQYRDRAKERRAKYGQPEPPLPKRSKPDAEAEPEPVPWVLLLFCTYLSSPLMPWHCWLSGRKWIKSVVKHISQKVLFRNTLCLKKIILWLAITLTHVNGLWYFFGRNVTDKLSNQKKLYYATSSILCFCTTWKNLGTRKLHFSLKCCIIASPEFNQLLDSFNLFDSTIHTGAGIMTP